MTEAERNANDLPVATSMIYQPEQTDAHIKATWDNLPWNITIFSDTFV